MGSSDTYLIRPNHKDKFKPAVVKECIRELVREQLTGVRYDSEEVQQLSRTLADSIKDRVKRAGFDRYKLAVQVVIGEQRGQGVKPVKLQLDRIRQRYAKGNDSVTMDPVNYPVKLRNARMSTRCFWDADADSYAEDVFITESLFCAVVVFGSYYY